MLQEREQQGEGEDSSQAGRPGASTARGRSASSSRSASSASPSPFRRTIFPPRAPSSSPSREESPSPSRRPQQPGEQRRSPPSPQKQLLRPRAGSRTLHPPSRSCPSPEVPSQLLGGRPGTHADLSTQSLSDSSSSCDRSSTARYHSAQAAKAEEHLQALVLPRVQILQSQTSSQSSQSLPNTPESGGSTSPSSPSAHSVLSYTSSFADKLRTNRKDYRLLKKRSRPSEHLARPSAAPTQRPVPTVRTPSYYRPKVVEDTADVPHTTAAVTDALGPPSVLLSPPIGAKRKLSFSTPDHRLQDIDSFISKPLLRSSTWQSLSTIRRRKQNSSTSPDRSKSSSQDHEHSEGSHILSSKTSKSLLSKRRHFHVVTPPEMEPGTPGHSPFRSGDSYFRTFRQDTIDQKLSATPMSPASPVTVVAATPYSSGLSTSTASSQSASPRPTMFARHRSRRGSSILRPYGRKSSSSSSQPLAITPGGAMNGPPSTPTPVRKMPAVTFSMPSTAYFTKSRRMNRSSEGSPRSPTSIAPPRILEMQSEDDLRHQETESYMSPLHRAKRPCLMRRDSAERVPDLRSMAKSMDEGENPTAGHAGISWAPSLIKRISTEMRDDAPNMARKKPSMPFRGFFFDATSMPETSEYKRSRASVSNPSLRKIKQRESMLSLVLKSMESRRSINKLQRKPSHPAVRRSSSTLAQHLSIQEQASSVPVTVRSIKPGDLEVRDFYTTPFPQRERDAILAERAQVRVYIEECLNDPNDHNTILGHEVDVPDHLPSSPLCPLSVKHKSGGKAICPLHRRRKRPVAVKRTSTVKPSLIANRPTIVYESGMDGKMRD